MTPMPASVRRRRGPSACTTIPALLPVLMNHLHDSDSLAGDQVARAIGTIGDRSVSADLLNLLATAPAVERTRAALALGMLKSEEAVPGLAALLSTGDPQAQRVAAEALAAIGTPSAIAHARSAPGRPTDDVGAPRRDGRTGDGWPARRGAVGGSPARLERGGPRQRRGNARLAETSERRGRSGPIALGPESRGAGSGGLGFG